MTLHVARRGLACGLCGSVLLLLPAIAAGQGSRNAPAAPTNLQSALDGQGRVNLTWTDQSTNELGFRIVRERQISASTWGDAAGFTVGSNTATYLDSPSLGTYRYRVRAYNQKGNSSYTPRVEVTVSAASQVPAAPTGLAVQDSGGGNARVIWIDASSNETGFEIERQPAFAASPQRVGADVVSFNDATQGGTFAYRVRAVNATSSSSFTSWVSASIQAPSNSLTAPPFPALIPRSGWTGPTPQPPAVGTPGAPGYDAKAIARWDVVPYQTFTSDFYVGVVAFHINGIDRVDFAVNGGPWVSVRQMQLNPQTNVWEYTAMLRAADFADGAVEVRAIAWPVVGDPRVLESLPLSANVNGSFSPQSVYVSPSGSDTGSGSLESPFRSLMKAAKVLESRQGGDAGRGNILLLAGDHPWGPAERDANGVYIGRPTTLTGYLNISPAPGVSQSEVAIIAGGSGGLKTEALHIRNVTLRTGINNASIVAPRTLWLEDCVCVGQGPTVDTPWMPPTSWPNGRYAIRTQVTGSRYGLGAPTLARGCRIDQTGDDAFANPDMLVDCDVTGVRIPTGSGYHSDLVQYHASEVPVDNRIIYGLRAHDCVAQGFHIGYTGHVQGPDWSNVAIVNSLFSYEGGATAQWIPRANHVLWWNNTIVGGPVYIRENPLGGLPTVVRNLSIVGCVFESLNITPSTSPAVMSNNHFVSGSPIGQGASTGNPAFINPLVADFRPSASSPLVGRIAAPLVDIDVLWLRRPHPAAVGAAEPPAN